MKMLIMGDVCPTVSSDPLFDQKEHQELFHSFPELIKSHDFAFVNLECALTASTHAIGKFGPNLKASKNTAAVLKEIGIDCCGLSNNHIFDFGIEGYVDTVAALEEAGLSYTGFGENYADSRKNFYIKDGSKTICIIAVCEHEYSYALDDRMGSRPFDPFDTLEDIAQAKKVADRVVVIYHGGKEHCRYPSPRLLKACRAMVRAGADLVTCQHSHCIGCYEQYLGGHILYGQGNFHFVKFTEENADMWDSGLAISYDADGGTVSFVPYHNRDNGIDLAQGERAEQIMKEFKARNASLLDGTWIDGWRAFCEKSREWYTTVVRRAQSEGATQSQNNMFGHYLDCEAHLDVWRELFPTANQTNEK